MILDNVLGIRNYALQVNLQTKYIVDYLQSRG